MSNANPTSLQSGFARTRSEAEFPRLFPDLVWLCPSLNPLGGTRLHDLSGRQNWGTLNNMEASGDWVSLESRGALQTDGVNEYILGRIPAVNLAVDSVTCSFWYRNNTSSTGIYFALSSSTNGTPFLIFQASSGSINLGHRTDASADQSAVGGTFQSSVFSHVVGVSTPSSLTLYQNGRQVATTARTAGATNFNQFTISALDRAGSLSNYTAMAGDDFRIFRGALLLPDVRQLYQLGRGNMPRARRRRYTEQDTGNRRRRVLLGAEC